MNKIFYFLLILYTTALFSQPQSDKEMGRTLEERSKWVSEKFSKMKIKAKEYSRPRSDSVLNQFESPSWVTENDRRYFNKAYQNRYKNVMQYGIHYSSALGEGRYRQQKLQEKKLAITANRGAKIAPSSSHSIFWALGIGLLSICSIALFWKFIPHNIDDYNSRRRNL